MMNLDENKINKHSISFLTVMIALLTSFIYLLAVSIIKASSHHLTIQHLLSSYALYYFTLTIFLVFIIGKYSRRYLQSEEGAERFWALYFTFATGLVICSFSQNLETFFIGWELVGLSSFFLIGFYQKNSRAIENSLLALANYKLCDIFFMLAILLEETSQFEHSFLVGLCLILSTLAKSAQFPFSSWLYRALEGPTPSSTAFYGGLSLHLGPFLLLQFHSTWDNFLWLKILLIFIGVVSTIYGQLVGPARSDVKTSLAFASLSQVGLIYIEIGFGLYDLAMMHIIGHSIIRTWSYLRASSFFNDYISFDYRNNKKYNTGFLKRIFPAIYIHALNNFYLDQIFINLRKIAAIVYIIIMSGYFLFNIKNSSMVNSLSLFFIVMANLFSIYCLFKTDMNLKIKLRLITFSQLGLLLSMWLIEGISLLDLNSLKTHLASLTVSVLALVILSYGIRPAFSFWDNDDEYSGEYFLGLKSANPLNSIMYFVSAISLSALPGTLQYIFQEDETFFLWKISPIIAIFVLSGLAINSYSLFKIGSHAFFGNFSKRKSLI